MSYNPPGTKSSRHARGQCSNCPAPAVKKPDGSFAWCCASCQQKMSAKVLARYHARKGEQVGLRVAQVQKSLPAPTGASWWCDAAKFYQVAKQRLAAGLIRGTGTRVAGGEW